MNNLTVYLIKEFGTNSIDAAQVSNVVNGTVNFVPVIAAIVADSFRGCFSVVWISTLISLLGIVLLALTASIDSLRPQQCINDSNFCMTPTKLQLALLYGGIALASIGVGGMRTNIATIGANQFHDSSKNQNMFFNWFFFTMYTGTIIGTTVIVYIEDNIGWKVRFYVCVAANFFGLVVFLAGSRFYYYDKLEHSPFTCLARVVVATIRKRKLQISTSQNHMRIGIMDRMVSLLKQCPFHLQEASDS